MSLPLLEGKQKPLKHRLGRVAKIMPELELAKILRKMFPTDVDMRTPDAVLEPGPIASKAVHMNVTAHILSGLATAWSPL